VDIGWGTDDDTFTMSWTEREGLRVRDAQMNFATKSGRVCLIIATGTDFYRRSWS